MAGDIKLKYGTSAALVQTALDGLASSSDWRAGWTSASIDNTSVLAQDYLISGEFKMVSGPPTAGVILVLAYAAFDTVPNWPTLFSSGTAGVQGAATITDTEMRDAGFVRLAAITTDAGGGDVYAFASVSIRDAFGQVPPHFAIFVAHSCVTALETTSDPNKIYYTPVLSQYT